MDLGDGCHQLLSSAITPAWIRRKKLGLVGPALPLLGICRRLTFYGDVRPDLSISSIDLEPLFEAGLSVRLDRIDRAFRLADAAVDAFVRVDDEHVLTLIEAVDRTNLDTVHVLTLDTAFIDDVGQLSLLPSTLARLGNLRRGILGARSTVNCLQ